MSRGDAPIWELPDDEAAIEGLDEHGDPDPDYAAALGIVAAPQGRRALAAAIDIAGYCLLQVPYWIFTVPLLLSWATGRISSYGLLNHPDFVLAVVVAAVTTVLTLAYCVVQLALHGRSGLTLGKGLNGLRSVNVKTLEKPGIWRVTLRALVVWGSSVVVVGPILFFLSPLFDPQKRGRGWHDVVGQTWLVDVRHGLQPYDKKRLRIARKTVTAAPAPRAKALPSLATTPGEDPRGEYRPAARTSAGVLGVARPHGAGPRPVIGLSGLEQSATPRDGGSAAEPGRPVIGGYLASPQAGTPEPAPAPQRSPGGVPPSSAKGEERPVEEERAARSADTVASERERSPEFVLRLDTGQRVEVGEAVVIGRMPASVDGARPVPITDEDFSVSKTHAALRPVSGGVEVVDQGSTNGTAILRRGEERELEPGEAAVAAPGETIRFGDRTAVVVPA